MLNIYYLIPVSVLTPVKSKTVSKVTKNEEPLSLNLSEPSKMKSLALHLSLNFKTQLLIDVQLIKELLISPKK